MDILAGLIKLIFGSKADKDRKQSIYPAIAQIYCREQSAAECRHHRKGKQGRDDRAKRYPHTLPGIFKSSLCSYEHCEKKEYKGKIYTRINKADVTLNAQSTNSF